jgi:hypothetical protein
MTFDRAGPQGGAESGAVAVEELAEVLAATLLDLPAEIRARLAALILTGPERPKG